ncbi:Homeobox domain-containing protein [Aphelenchoides bicaudatus]|nr:Homeobox domain-containing protein [Aphelenchoides bicaudatus]
MPIVVYGKAKSGLLEGFDKVHLDAYRSLDQIENELRTVQVKRDEAETQKTVSPVVSALSQPSQLQTSPPAALAADQLSSPIVRQLNTQSLPQFAQASRCALTTVPESCLFGSPIVSAALSLPSPSCQSTPASASSSTMSQSVPPVFKAEHFRFPVPAQLCSTTNTVITQSTLVSNQSSSGVSATSPSSSSSVCRPLRPTQQQPRSSTTGQRLEVPLENPNEVEEFMQQGEEFCINEMKKFITQYSLRQTTVAQMTGNHF